MAKPTKATMRLARTLGTSPATLQRWVDRGDGPAVDLSPKATLSYFTRLGELTGRGHDDDVAVLRMAAEGLPAIRLRALLKTLAESPTANDPDAILQGTRSTFPDRWRSIVGIAGMAAPLTEEVAADLPSPEGQAEIVAGSAFLEVIDPMFGCNGPEDEGDLGHILDGVSGATLPPTVDDRTVIKAAIGLAAESSYWLDNATPLELAKGVQAGRIMVDAIGALSMGDSDVSLGPAYLGEEESWRWAGRYAPVAVPLLHKIATIFELVVPLGVGSDNAQCMVQELKTALNHNG